MKNGQEPVGLPLSVYNCRVFFLSVKQEGYMKQEEIGTVLQNTEEKERNWCKQIGANFRRTYQNADLSHCKHEFENPQTIKKQNKKKHEACQEGFTEHPTKKRRCFMSEKLK